MYVEVSVLSDIIKNYVILHKLLPNKLGKYNLEVFEKCIIS